jgi:hypothetical protein
MMLTYKLQIPLQWGSLTSAFASRSIHGCPAPLLCFAPESPTSLCSRSASRNTKVLSRTPRSMSIGVRGPTRLLELAEKLWDVCPNA